MCSYHKIKIKISFIYTLFSFLSGCNIYITDKYEVLFVGIPQKITVKEAETNLVYYILKQTHEPLFRKDDGENFTSKILKNWSRNLNYQEYTFCPNTDLRFNDKVIFDKKFFFDYINETTKKFDKNFTVKEFNDCFRINFSKPQKRYLDFLTFYENSPTVKRNENVEDGLGKFYVEKISKDNMVIRRKKNIKNGYNQIVVYEYKGKNDPNLNNRNIEDFNLIPSFDVPEWVKNKYIGFNNIELKSVLLILNHPNKKVRKLLYNCIDIDEIRTSFYPNRKDFYDIQTVLPLGVYGAKAGKSFQKCEITTKNNLKPLTFINWMYDNDKDMDEFSNNFYRKTGIKINIIKIQPSELVKILNRYPRVYNLTVIIFDAVRNDLTAFFEPFAKETGFHDFIIHEIKDLYNKLIYEIDEDKKREIAIKMAEIIKDEALALPLYQSVRKLYYPPHIKNINVGRDFLQYPEISEFRW